MKHEPDRFSHIEGQLEMVLKLLDEDRQHHKLREKETDEYRAGVRMEINRLERETEQLNEWRRGRVDPFIQMGTSIKAKITGAVLVLGIVGGIVWAGLQYFKEQIIGVLWP